MHNINRQKYEEGQEAISADIGVDTCSFALTAVFPCRIGKLLLPAAWKAVDETEAGRVQSV